MYLISDIETVTDLSLWQPPAAEPDPTPPADTQTAVPGTAEVAAQATKKPRKSRKKKLAPGVEPFAPLYAHRVIAIGSVVLDDNFNVVQMLCAGTTSFGDNEALLLSGWAAWAQQLAEPTLVTFNGRAFDVPVLSLRAFRHGLPMAFQSRDYQYRYGDKHLDLFDRFTEYGHVQRAGMDMDVMCGIMGLPPAGQIDGSKVASLFRAGRAAEIETYCLADVCKTTFLLLRYLLVRGVLPVERYRSAASAFLNQCGARGLGGSTFACDVKRLLLEG